MNIKALCTWGDGPDVLLVLKGELDTGKRFILYESPRHIKDGVHGDYIHGFVTNGSLDLTKEEAELLAGQLMEAARQARQLEKGLDEI